ADRDRRSGRTPCGWSQRSVSPAGRCPGSFRYSLYVPPAAPGPLERASREWRVVTFKTSRKDRLGRLFELHFETQALEFLHQNVEGFRRAGLGRVLALDDRLVNARSAADVVALHRQQLLKRVGRSVRLERPHFHFTEALAAELGLAPQGLLRDQRVRTRRARVDLVIHEVRKFQHVQIAHRDALIERIAGAAVVQVHLAVLRQAGLLELALDLLDRGPGEHRRRAVVAQRVRRPAEVGLEDLADVHAARHAERVQDDLHHLAIRQVGQVFLRHDARHHALVAVAAGHLVAHRQLATLGDVHLHQLHHARRQLVATRDLLDLLLQLLLAAGERVLGVVHRLPEPLVHTLVLGHRRSPRQVVQVQLLEEVARDLATLARERLARRRALQHVDELLVEDLLGVREPHVRDALALLLGLAAQLLDLLLLLLLRALVLLAAREHLDVDDNAVHARRRLQRRVTHVASL